MLKNVDMDNMMESLKPFLDRKDLIGYAAARNTRLLQEQLVEYHTQRDNLVRTYGEPNTDDEGNEDGTYSLRSDSANWSKFVEELSTFAEIEHDPQLMTIPAKEVIGELTGQEILDIDWMLDYEDEVAKA